MNACPPAHHYAATSCLHEEHTYCQSHTGLSGSKKPASCKFCGARCVCTCHVGDPHPHIPPDPLVADLRRELGKTLVALGQCRDYLARHAEANAALHCASDRVMHSPLHAAVVHAIHGAQAALDRTDTTPADKEGR